MTIDENAKFKEELKALNRTPVFSSAGKFNEYIETLLDKEYPDSNGDVYVINIIGTPTASYAMVPSDDVFNTYPSGVHPLKQAFCEICKYNSGEIFISVRRRLDELGNWSRPISVILNFD